MAIGGAFLYLILGVPVGVLAARRRGTTADKALVTSTLVSQLGALLPVRPLAFLTLTICHQLLLRRWGTTPFTENPAKWFSGMLLAWLALGIYGCTTYTRYSRGSMVESLSEDYIRTAKAKGLRARTVVFKHALRSALVPVITIFGIDFGFLLAGTIFTERIFDIEGIGMWGLQAVATRTCRWCRPPACSRRPS